VVQQRLRHSTQQVTTEVYMHLFPEEMERLRESLDRVYSESTTNEFNDGMITASMLTTALVDSSPMAELEVQGSRTFPSAEHGRGGQFSRRWSFTNRGEVTHEHRLAATAG
jgi:hypothetical protein